MASGNDIGPFQTIVNVSWAGTRYLVVEIFNNASVAPDGNVWTPHSIAISGTVGFLGSLTLDDPFVTPRGSFVASSYATVHDLSEVNTIKKRKALIDAATDYFLLLAEAWYGPGEGAGSLNAVQVGWVFLLGKYAMDFPTRTSFAVSKLSPALDFLATRPLMKTTAGTANWGDVQVGFDGGPFNRGP